MSIVFKIPKNFNNNYVFDFLKTAEKMFSMNLKSAKEVVLEVQNVREISLIGILLLYKFMDYSTKNNCFLEPQILIDTRNLAFDEAVDKYGFRELIYSFIDKRYNQESIFKNIKVTIDEKFILAPQPLIRKKNISNEMLSKDFLPKIQEYYSSNDKAVRMIFQCFSEIFLNFWEHATDDDNSIVVAEGNQMKIEIACSDNGNGIVSTLRNCNNIYSNLLGNKVLEKSVQKKVTSKPCSNHMGYGLWIIDQITRLVKGKFQIYSEGFYYSNEYGKISSGKCGYWKGTIIYLYLPLGNPITLHDIIRKDSDILLDNLKINFL